jgi:hypothetical protein
MNHLNFLNDMKFICVENVAGDGQSTLTTDVVDTQGFDSVAFIVKTGDVTSGSVLTLTAKTNSANSISSPAPVVLTDTVTYTATTASDADDKLLILDLHKPRQRYVFGVLTIGTQNATIEGIFALLYNAHDMPLTVDSSVIDYESVNDPA